MILSSMFKILKDCLTLLCFIQIIKHFCTICWIMHISYSKNVLRPAASSGGWMANKSTFQRPSLFSSSGNWLPPKSYYFGCTITSAV